MLLIVFSFLLVGTQAAFDDQCNLGTISQFGMEPNQTTELEIPQNCTSGVVDWSYPMGYLHLVLSLSGQSYSLCIVKSWATYITEVKDVTDGRNQVLDLPTEKSPSCAVASNGVTELQLKAPSHLMYMNGFDYKVVPRV
ncbi:uncharacterized protein LOC131934681 [Physella acuta]|uniref:uncharacterized protein LOC131934681 n=1 Tax=Physella acuta TaxID=109671 RepID=UPI0027DD16DB|nr:uncharacterized protein LOC131934681 [Physella acuta]